MTNESNNTTATQAIPNKEQYIKANTVDVPTTPASLFQADVGRTVATKKNTGVVVLRYEPEAPKVTFLRSDS